MRVSMLIALAAAAASVAVTGCSGSRGAAVSTTTSTATWQTARCRAQAAKVAGWGEGVLVHYAGTTVYPADMSYLLLRDALRQFERHGCAASVLGRTLASELSAAQRRRLLGLLPSGIARTLRRAISAGGV